MAITGTETSRPRKKRAPEPIMEAPEIEDLMAWEMEGYCEATDGCCVEPDGICMHGHESWLLRLGYI